MSESERKFEMSRAVTKDKINIREHSVIRCTAVMIAAAVISMSTVLGKPSPFAASFAAAMSGKIKTVLQMIAVPMLLLLPVFQNSFDLPASLETAYYYLTYAFLWASLVMTVYSGAEYVIKNKEVFKQ